MTLRSPQAASDAPNASGKLTLISPSFAPAIAAEEEEEEEAGDQIAAVAFAAAVDARLPPPPLFPAPPPLLAPAPVPMASRTSSDRLVKVSLIEEGIALKCCCRGGGGRWLAEIYERFHEKRRCLLCFQRSQRRRKNAPFLLLAPFHPP